MNYKNKTTIIFLISISMLLFNNVYAGEVCDIFNKAKPEHKGILVLSIVDSKLSNWEKNEKLKGMMSDFERIELFKDAIDKISYYCKTNNDFKAGVALGEELVLYKKMLVEIK